MPDRREINLDLWKNRDVFEEINLQTENFLNIFSELANLISLDRLKSIHPYSKGMKISKGNQLSQCPYQVLDILRDFHPQTGFNIRLLNWFGHGMMIFLHYAPTTAIRFQKTIERISTEFHLSKTSSPWDYSQLILSPDPEQVFDVAIHLSEFNHVQLFKFITIEKCSQKTLFILTREVESILDYHSG
ncbi:hypothetical protein P872_02735 [Rhodonellum psychrophilum GCM71 = DSM 17998]|uniref:Uncharacterized protein n=2 Tax=Rhodonellum TaxID=336827 RepID=U5BT22_9BACT|nr:MULTISPECIES: hypothetical protein [Rhodonellum]ERM83735.1 hypothetical protein P872_02735 [Rhodonellum psychrophilum GCM71 = DSM 17998]SDY89510.1 hypothetical protein SAMN05444412_103302 [Rhodonellum ikkaensis]